jgi:hypothetical protein
MKRVRRVTLLVLVLLLTASSVQALCWECVWIPFVGQECWQVEGIAAESCAIVNGRCRLFNRFCEYIIIKI